MWQHRGQWNNWLGGQGRLHTGLKAGEEPATEKKKWGRGEAKNISGEDTARLKSTEVGDRMVCMDGNSWRRGHSQRRRYLNAVSKFGALLCKQWGTIKDFKHREWSVLYFRNIIL